MNTRKTLFQIGGIESEIEVIQDEILRTESQLTRVTPVLSDMPKGGGNNDKMANGISDLIAWKAKLNRKICQLIRVKDDAMASIYKIQDERYRRILISHYFKHEPLTKIAYEMGYEYYYLAALHKRALTEFAKHHNKSQMQT